MPTAPPPRTHSPMPARATVFISYSRSPKNREWVCKLAARLRQSGSIEVLLDEDQRKGEDIDAFMDQGIKSADAVLMVLTPDYVYKARKRIGGVGTEINWIRHHLKSGPGRPWLIPVLRGDLKGPSLDFIDDKFPVDMREEGLFEQGVRAILDAILPPRPRAEAAAGKKKSLAGGLTEAGEWPRLLGAAVAAVTAGGMAAMSFYRRTLDPAVSLWDEGSAEKNPSTQADLEATSAMLQAVDPYLAPIARRMGCALKYLGEETKNLDWFRDHLNQETFERIQPGERFFSSYKNEIKVIIDGIDGTGSFVRGIPLFCSALAILVGDQPRVASIYDPIHHIVYSALLPGPPAELERGAEAWAWSVATGNRVDLVAPTARQPSRELRKEAVGVHFTRSHPEKLISLLRSASLDHESVFETLSKNVGALYALNSGLLAMTEVARGSLGAFFNAVTNLWDIAAGEVLVRACGGRVTDRNGRPIEYSEFRETPILAAREPLHSALLRILAPQR